MGWRSGQSYSQDLRDRVMGAVDGGMAVRDVAAVFKVSIAYIYKALIRRRLTGDISVNRVQGRPPRKLSPEQEQALGTDIRSRPGITLAQAQSWLQAEHSVTLSMGAMWNTARRLGLSFKKSPARQRTGSARRRGKAQAVAGDAAVHCS
jgi:transposase